MRTRIAATLCVIVALASGACRKDEKDAAPPAPVQVAPVIRGSLRHIVSAEGVVYPREQASLVPKISAPVKRYLAERGDHVKAGQLVAELENRDLAAAAVASRGQFTQAESNLRTTRAATVPEAVTKAQTDAESAKLALDAAQKVFESRQELLKQGAIARKQVDEAQVALAQARGQYETARQHLDAMQAVGREEQIRSAEGQREAARGQLDAAQAQVEYTRIRSPIAGVITDRPLWPGEMASPDKPVLTVMDLSAVVARISMSQAQAKDIKVGAAATLSEGEGAEPLPGTVTVVSAATDPNSTTVQVWVQAANPGGRLRAGTSVHVAIVAATIDGALVAPAAAVLASDEGGSKVIVVDDKDVAHEKTVEVGVREGDRVQIVAGLGPGDRVVTVGGVGLADKAKVRIVDPGGKRAGEADGKDEDHK